MLPLNYKAERPMHGWPGTRDMPPAMPGRPTLMQSFKNGPRAIAQSDGFVFVSPEYNYGTSAMLKNAIDRVYSSLMNHDERGRVRQSFLVMRQTAMRMSRQLGKPFFECQQIQLGIARFGQDEIAACIVDDDQDRKLHAIAVEGQRRQRLNFIYAFIDKTVFDVNVH
jgi:hypothetical protein